MFVIASPDLIWVTRRQLRERLCNGLAVLLILLGSEVFVKDRVHSGILRGCHHRIVVQRLRLRLFGYNALKR